MRNIQEWIEAQLKRGYSAKSIKSVLVKRGYPSKAVAEVDKASYSASSKTQISKKFSSKPFLLMAIFAGIMLMAWLINKGSLNAPLQQINNAPSASENQDSSIIQPSSTFKNANGELVEIYSGIIANQSPAGMTLENNGSVKNLQFSEKRPPVFIIGSGPERGNFLETAQIGDKALVQLIVAEEMQYASRVMIYK